MGCRLLCVTLLALLAGCYGQPCTLITPSVLHRDSDETIVLDGHTMAFEAEVQVQNFPKRTLSLMKQKISLNYGNNFLGTATVRISSKDLAKDPKSKQYVYVTVTSPVCSLEKVVLLGHQSGYAFIQTDKTIYTPGSTVLYRIYAMDGKLSPVNTALVIEFLSSDNVIVERRSYETYGNSGIIRLSYRLPELVSSLGVWTMSVRYEGSPLHLYSTSFEVKEYVLPTIEIKLIPEKIFYNFEDPEFIVDIKAQFLYGKPVDGMALVIFGVKKDDTRTSLPDTQRRIPISEGEGQAVLKREDLVKSFPNPDDLLQYTLYMSVTIITDSGKKVKESELENIHIVKSPYNVLFSKTSRYFKPGMPFDLLVHVTNPDGSPAQRVPVVAEPGRVEGITGAEGKVRLKLNTAANINSLSITVRTSDPWLPPSRQASASMTANAYQSTGNYLSIISTYDSDVRPGDTLSVYFILRNTNVALQNQIFYFTYLITTKGRIVKVGRQPRLPLQSLVTMSLPITEELVPSFRITAYYIVGNEIVSDSMRVDVRDSCMGTLSGVTYRDNGIQSPGSAMNLKLQADQGAHVGLVVVDRGVHVLNRKFKISQKKMWDSVEKSDTGCTPGGGADSMGVFYDAGLALQSTLQSTTQQRSEQQCEVHSSRRRRSSAQVVDQTMTNASSSQEIVRRCCIDGMNEKGENCEGRAANIWEGRECADAFLHCCKFIRQKKEKERNPTEPDAETRGSQYEVAASRRRRCDDDNDYLPDYEIPLRTDFPDSWFWKIEHMGERADRNGISTKLLDIFLKDSVTTWEVQAVSLSPNKGICVSEPYEIRVLKDFFIDLELPYSVVRNEQVEIQSVIYNYGHTTIRVRVELTHNPQFCSLSTAKSNFRQVVEIRPQSSVAVPFILVPLSLGDQDVEVKAAVFGQYLADGVRKKLKVVPQGVRITKNITSAILDPQVTGNDGVQVVTVPAVDEKNLVPGTSVETLVTIQGNPGSQMEEHVVNGGDFNHLFVAPYGSMHSNIIRMTSNLFSTIYLETTNQWDRLGLDRRDEAITNIKKGYINQLAFRNSDNSYGTLKGSTWFTAYVVKVFAMAQSLVDIKSNVLCDSIKWLILQKQKSNGMFKEDAPVWHWEIVGGIKGSSEDVALTAFVLIAMLESEEICAPQVNNLKISIEKASSFLLGQLPALDKPYTIAITSYALAMAGAIDHPQKLLSAITDNSHWSIRGSNYNIIEATSYALLALMHLKQYNLTKPMVRWIYEKKNYGIAYRNTQASLMMFQALTRYHMDFPSINEIQLDVTLDLPDDPFPVQYRINSENAMVARTSVTRWNKEFVVRAEGKGQVTLTVTSVYHVTEKDKECKNFDLSVSVKEEPNVRAPEGALATASVTICARHLKNRAATLSMLEVSMMTGFTPDVDSLNKLMKRMDTNVIKFENNNKDNDQESLILYLDKISHRKDECITFNVHQIFKVGLIQPGSVTVYDYYSPESRCSKLYHMDKDIKSLGTICQNNECRCAENCFSQKPMDDKIDAAWRYERVCTSGVDYVYKVHLEEIQKNDNYDNYVMKIIRVLREGGDEDALNNQKNFLSHIKCRKDLILTKGQDYLIWGPNTDLWEQPDGFSYLIRRDTWMERWPNDRECQGSRYSKLCNDLSELSENLEFIGCHL
ncbi:A.superbus venom factor 1-like isoform X3 [Engystomops pustulosus]|uniref:A.superbus venom factor 1-like isoform X3 n=1 Tax=Engystomops pustulosus TaxID=76066 RepID=UPI003AFA8659